MVHVVAFPRLIRASVPPPVKRDDAINSAIPFTFLFQSCCLFTAPAQNQTPKAEPDTDQAVQLKAIKTPFVPYPEEARKNLIGGPAAGKRRKWET